LHPDFEDKIIDDNMKYFLYSSIDLLPAVGGCKTLVEDDGGSQLRKEIIQGLIGYYNE
jgi:hypothetical protein